LPPLAAHLPAPSNVFLNGVQFFDEEEEIFDQVKKKFLTK